ncbi:MAG: ABC transporter ATP-binding protein [Candidatus Omnitrophica bacterium]|nr:ABC transporter ATP-binding protein [Candidatus Omnitrophota bacterium]
MPFGRNKEYSKLSIGTVKDAFRLFFRFNGYLNRYRRAESVMLAAGSISILLSLAAPYLGKLALDDGVLGKNMVLFLKYAVIGGAIYILRQAADKGNLWIRDVIIRKMRINLAKDAFKRIRHISLASFQDASVGECVSRINADINVSANIITNTLPELIKALLRLVLITAIIFFINGKLLLLIICYQFVVIGQIYFFTKKHEELAMTSYKKNWEMSKILTQLFSQIYFVKASGAMGAMIRKYFRTFADSVRVDVKTSRLDAASGILSELSSKLFFGMIGFVGTLLVIKGELTLGSLGAIAAYLSQGTGAYTAVLGIFQKIVLNRLSLERMAELLDIEASMGERSSAKKIDFSECRIEFKGVTFGYDGTRRILDNMNFTVSPGAKIALVGPSGCGKTTIANLILRLYDVNSGGIFLRDCDIREIKFKSIYDQIGLVPQSPFIWSGSIREIITGDNPKIGEPDIIEAAELAEIHSFITGLPAGYDTVLSDIISKVSQGQKQRIAIARALAKRPKILIMDEASSSLDSNTEEKIIDNIKRRYPGLTFIIISHRFSAVSKMDTVYFFKGPGEMAVSTHPELADNDIKYTELFANQLEKIC